MTTPHQKIITAIVPSYNEEKNLGAVIRALKESNELSDILVVDDGSTDRTSEVARQEGVRVVRQENQGKAAAMAKGAQHTNAEILLFVDADLVGFSPDHISALLKPVIAGDAGMTVGIRDRGFILMWMMEHILPIIGGERALSRDVFLRMIPNNTSRRFGIETVMNAYCKKQGIPVRLVRQYGVGHILKEVRYGVWKGMTARMRMIVDILITEITVLFH